MSSDENRLTLQLSRHKIQFVGRQNLKALLQHIICMWRLQCFKHEAFEILHNSFLVVCCRQLN